MNAKTCTYNFDRNINRTIQNSCTMYIQIYTHKPSEPGLEQLITPQIPAVHRWKKTRFNTCFLHRSHIGGVDSTGFQSQQWCYMPNMSRSWAIVIQQGTHPGHQVNQLWGYGGFLKWWYQTAIGFPTKIDFFGVFWGYRHFRKHPYGNRLWLLPPCHTKPPSNQLT